MNDERAANAIDRRFGQRVRTRRLEIGLSQERLAETLGITFQQVQKYEKGTNRIAASRLFDIAKALDVPIGFFFEGLPSAPKSATLSPAAPVHETLATPEGVALIRWFAAIQGKKALERVLALVRALAEPRER